jgi:hypothetical protein
VTVQPPRDETVHVRRTCGKNPVRPFFLREGSEYASATSREPRGRLPREPIEIFLYDRVHAAHDRLQVVANAACEKWPTF